MAKTKKANAKTERRNANDRRTESDRRTKDVPIAKEARKGLRRKVQRRRQIDPTTCERDYSADEIEFMHALDAYKRSSGRMFPTCSEILEVIRALGYERLIPPLAEPKSESEALAETGESAAAVTHGAEEDPPTEAGTESPEMPPENLEQTNE